MNELALLPTLANAVSVSDSDLYLTKKYTVAPTYFNLQSAGSI